MCTQSEIKSAVTLFKQDSKTQQCRKTNLTLHTAHMHECKVSDHCVFICSPNLGARVPLRGKNLYGVREWVEVRLPLGFQRMSRIWPLKRYDQCTETRGDSSVTMVAWIAICSEPPKYWGYGIYIDFRFVLPIPFFVYLCSNKPATSCWFENFQVT